MIENFRYSGGLISFNWLASYGYVTIVIEKKDTPPYEKRYSNNTFYVEKFNCTLCANGIITIGRDFETSRRITISAFNQEGEAVSSGIYDIAPERIDVEYQVDENSISRKSRPSGFLSAAYTKIFGNAHTFAPQNTLLSVKILTSGCNVEAGELYYQIGQAGDGLKFPIPAIQNKQGNHTCSSFELPVSSADRKGVTVSGESGRFNVIRIH